MNVTVKCLTSNVFVLNPSKVPKIVFIKSDSLNTLQWDLVPSIANDYGLSFINPCENNLNTNASIALNYRNYSVMYYSR